MSILAHVVLRGNRQAEPVATQALAYILNSSSRLAEAFLKKFNSAGISFNLGRIEPETAVDDGQPDIIIYDDMGSRRLLIENKFWAGLTKAQPVSYMKSLENEHSGLLFIVPSERIPYVWNELKARLIEKNYELGQESSVDSMRAVSVGNCVLLISSWEQILEELQLKARIDGLHEIEQDIGQLLELAKQISETAFLPLRSEELSNQALPKRIMNYFRLLSQVIGELQSDVIVGKTSNGSNDYQMARWFYVRGRTRRIRVWLGVAPDVWQHRGITPIWFWVGKPWLTNVAHFRAALEKVLDLTSSSFHEEEDGLYIPVPLKPNLEEKQTVAHAATTIREIVKILVDNFGQ